MQDHIIKSVDVEISLLKEAVMEMAKKCENQLEKAAQALKIMDCTLAKKVYENDSQINEIQHRIEEQAVAFLARRQPMAVDLRQLLAVMKIASELERIGDYAANVAQRVTKLSGTPPKEPTDLVITMANTGRIMIHDAIMAFLMLDLDKAVAVWNRDDEIDNHYFQLMNQMQSQMQQETGLVEDGTQLMFMGRCCERIGDHITNIAEEIYFIISGKSFIGQFE